MFFDVLVNVLDKYGMDTAQICLIGFCFWKLFSNHLKHIQDKINENSEKIDKISSKVEDMNIVFGERIATIEGRCGANCSKDKE